MADEQVSLTSLILIVVLGGLIIRYLFFPSQTTAQSRPRDAQSASRAREQAVERIQQMFPQVDRRTILWDLQRNGGNISATTDRILAGRMEAPPVTFQPPRPPTNLSPSASQQTKVTAKPAEMNLLQRYNLQDKVDQSETSENATGKGKNWKQNAQDRQKYLQQQRTNVIIEARKKMQAKLEAEKAAKAS
ncbi:hypothetical protein F5Y15DRAFT_300044 [Xylariaceae sp. FL0016]|nr:hypothetical protein F5Y15DRAFT_300044 [Xylariaceae sp. FL0016]